jgi:hypothetical protein
VHESLDLTQTLETVVQGVVEVAGFGVAAVNLARPDGRYEVVAVAGDEDARATLLGTAEQGEQWRALLAQSERLGQLHFVDGRSDLIGDDDIYSWILTCLSRSTRTAGTRSTPSSRCCSRRRASG